MKKTEIEKLEKVLRKTVKDLTLRVKGLDKEIKRTLSSLLNKFEMIYCKIYLALFEVSKKATSLLKKETAIKNALKTHSDKFESIEETFYILYHNIRKNQFLYADDKKVWWKDFLDLKKHYIKENVG